MTNKDPNFKVAIGVLSFDRPTITEKCLQSLRKLSADGLLPLGTQTFLLHNGSNPKTIQTLQIQYPEIQHKILTDNRGYAAGANALLKAIFETHDWVLFLSNDCQMLSFPTAPKQPSLVAPLVYRRKETHTDSLGAQFSSFRGRLRHCRSPVEFQKNSPLWSPYIPGSAYLMHRDVFQKTQGFDESLFTYWEDVDFSMKVKKMGFPLQIQPDWKILHGVGKTCHGKSLYSIFYFQRNRRIVSLRYSPRWLRPLNQFLLNRAQRKLQKQLLGQGRSEDALLMDKIF